MIFVVVTLESEVFCRHLGVGFQVLNDLKDWRGDSNNKLVAGQDAQALRPTVMLALAIDAATPEQRAELQEIIDMESTDESRGPRLKRVLEETGVFEKADTLVEKSRARAEALADNVDNEKLRQLLYFLVDTVLAPEDDQQPTVEPSPVMISLPVA